jgi:hypothetical protein
MSDSSAIGPESKASVQGPSSAQGWQGWRNAQERWRLELERAQLARAASVRSAEAPRTPPAPGTPEAAAARLITMPPGSRKHPVGEKQGGAPSSGFSPSEEENAATTSITPGETPAGEAAPQGASPARPDAPGRAAPVPLTRGAPAGRALFARPQWPEIQVHAAASGAGVEVSIRDASLGEARLREVAARLRAHFRSAGQRLARLTVNGQEIFSEEVDSCQSTR